MRKLFQGEHKLITWNSHLQLPKSNWWIWEKHMTAVHHPSTKLRETWGFHKNEYHGQIKQSQSFKKLHFWQKNDSTTVKQEDMKMLLAKSSRPRCRDVDPTSSLYRNGHKMNAWNNSVRLLKKRHLLFKFCLAFY